MKESRNEKKKRMETKRNNIIRRLFNREYLRIDLSKKRKQKYNFLGNTIYLERDTFHSKYQYSKQSNKPTYYSSHRLIH